MGSAPDSSSASRKARVAEMRRAERARDRRNRTIAIVAGAAVVVALVGAGAWAISRESGDSGAEAQGGSKSAGHFTTGEDGVKTWSAKLTQNHVAKTVDYPMTPPVGGDHNQVWMNCNGDVYTKAIANENAVHSLEHGAVWVTYNSKASEADVKALAEKVKATPYTLMSPVEDQKDLIMLSAWGKQRTVTGASDPNLDKFLETYVQGEQTPEPGAACTGGLSQ
ncbi:DUF3105 domain-containing protein [Streptomyces jeddahensis]|uniref:DUF3105 domain-containing protein n=1 Tax=Streptomyces jeddahensis TaxID=1716141 RepID=A0A177HRV3_9ACTN|nr:DUF3105 domain-containing protein [Streptomyces jeddahensis]OAH13741.1 hypothetical protein STSP_29120 [Streptomyces jeddahensis]